MVTGSGTQTDPYMIYTLADMELIGTSGYLLNAYYALANNIDASITFNASYNSGLGWVPIGTLSAPFTGVFNGNGYTISNLYINNPSLNNVGLIGYGSNSTITNVTVNGEITGGSVVGGIVGSLINTSQLLNCNFNGIITGAGYVGGIVGYTNPYSTIITITNSVPTGTINSTSDNVGGIVGFAAEDGSNTITDITIPKNSLIINSTGCNFVGGICGQGYVVNISNCQININLSGLGWIGGINGNQLYNGTYNNVSFNGNITGTTNIGGFLAQTNPFNREVIINECYVTGVLIATGNNVGGFIGRTLGAGLTQITNCYSNMTVSSTGSAVAGFIGYMQNTTLVNCYSNGLTAGNGGVGGFVGEDQGDNSASNCFWDTQASSQSSSAFGMGLTTTQMQTVGSYSGFDFTTPIWIINPLLNNYYPYLECTPLPPPPITKVRANILNQNRLSVNINIIQKIKAAILNKSHLTVVIPTSPGGISSLIISITPMGGNYKTTQHVTLTLNGLGNIYYTLDGSTPTNDSQEYTGPITISEYQTTLNYFAVDPEGNSTEMHTQSYQIGTQFGSQIDYGQEIRNRLPEKSALQLAGNPGRIMIDECFGLEFSLQEIASFNNAKARLIQYATGQYLDYYGQWFGFPRPSGMDDDIYRANLISLRMVDITIQGLTGAIAAILDIPESEITITNNIVNYCKAAAVCNADQFEGTPCVFGGLFQLVRNGITISVPSGSDVALLESVIQNMIIPGITVNIVTYGGEE